VNQIHLDVTPLLAAFRKDLLDYTLNGDVVMTPQMLKGIQFLRDNIARSCHVVSRNIPELFSCMK